MLDAGAGTGQAVLVDVDVDGAAVHVVCHLARRPGAAVGGEYDAVTRACRHDGQQAQRLRADAVTLDGALLWLDVPHVARHDGGLLAQLLDP